MVAALGIPAAVTTGLVAIEKALDLAAPILARYFPDKQKELEFRNDLVKHLVASDVAQLEVNRAEAQTASIFLGGWRPAFGWTGVAIFLFYGVFAPVLEAIVHLWKPEFAIPMSKLVADNVMEMIFGMLGLSAMRSWDKFKGVDTKAVAPVSRDSQSLAERVRQ